MRNRYLWLVMLITGVAIVVLLGIHTVMQHLDAILAFFGININDPTSWQSMIARSREALWAGIYIALLAVVLYHALYGLRNIVLELTPSAQTERIVTWIIVAFGVVTFVGASYVPIALLSV